MKNAKNEIICNNHRNCAEQRLLVSAIRDAVRHGVAPYATISWIRRKYGKSLYVWRYSNTETGYGISVPCVMCRQKLLPYDFDIHCVLSDGSWNISKLDNLHSKPTSTQRSIFRNKIK